LLSRDIILIISGSMAWLTNIIVAFTVPKASYKELPFYLLLLWNHFDRHYNGQRCLEVFSKQRSILARNIVSHRAVKGGAKSKVVKYIIEHTIIRQLSSNITSIGLARNLCRY